MDAPALPAHAEVDQALRRLQLGVDASELHGGLCGFLCGGGDAREEGWLTQLALEAAAGDHDAAPLRTLFAASRGQLADAEFGFELLLPDAERPLGERADALIAWARGFLGGFGLAAGPQAGLSAEAQEALEDLSGIAAAELSCDDPDSDEESLTEIAEFLRVVAMLLHSDRQMPAPDSSRLH